MLSPFKLALVIAVLLTIHRVARVDSADSPGDTNPVQSDKNATSIFHFSFQLLQRIQNYIFHLKPPASALKEKAKSPEAGKKKADGPVAVEKAKMRRLLDSSNESPAVTYRAVMMNVTDAFANLSSSSDDSSFAGGRRLCDPLPLNDTNRGRVQILNHTQLIETKVRRKDSANERGQSAGGRKSANSRSVSDVDFANTTRDKMTYCVMMMVYAHFCPFSKTVAPVYVALARVYPQVAFYAIHINDYKRVKSTMSAFGVPKIFLLKNGRTVSVFNKSVKSFHVLKSFVHNLTGFTALQNSTDSSATNVNQSDGVLDYGPFAFDTDEFDIYLLFSWAFILCLIANYFLCSSQGERLRRRVIQLWQEHHEHVN